MENRRKKETLERKEEKMMSPKQPDSDRRLSRSSTSGYRHKLDIYSFNLIHFFGLNLEQIHFTAVVSDLDLVDRFSAVTKIWHENVKDFDGHNSSIKMLEFRADFGISILLVFGYCLIRLRGYLDF